MSGSDKILSQKYSTSISARIICRQIAVLWLCTLRKQCTSCVIVITYCNLIAALMLQLTTLIDLTGCVFFFEVNNLPSRKFCFVTSRKLVFAISSPFRLIFFIFLVFNLIVILFGVKAFYFYYGKCSS